MLIELRLRNLAVIEEVTVPFGPGLNAVTGETGAGKSIVVDAILLVMGARAQPDLIRSGADSAVIEALFELPPDHPAAEVLEAAGHSAPDGALVLKREISRAGRHRVFVNDSPATVALLERLGESLVELHGQHEHQRLMEPGRQLDLLDRFADAEETRTRVGAQVREWEAARAELARVRAEAREGARQQDLYRFQLSEIDALALRDGEEDELRAERRRLQHTERIASGLAEVTGLLYDDAQSAAARLHRAGTVLRELAGYDPELGAPAEALGEAEAYLEDVIGRARALRDRAPFDPERLGEIDDRLDAIGKLKRKYGDSVEAIAGFRERIASTLDQIDRHDEVVAELEARVARTGESAGVSALVLAETRAAAARRLERLIQAELRGLGMEHARFRVGLRREPAGEGELAAGSGRWRVGRRGVDTAEFLFSANPGEDPRPLAKVVSGGELSRTMLAVRTVLSASGDVPTMVFDEVDAGIGGRVAEVVGQKLAQTARGRQVLCVTHLAPIAVYAAQHLRVEKKVGRGTTRTTVAPLAAADRIEELARMLGGERVTDATRRAARELFRSAQREGPRR
ncbi:MAG TPA: DNA repair protein RecN [Candidatus Nitrosocosmicus sp.]|nr:DNA repair protein RecN [Candidatus Nitrosocosmicus sp.]